MSAPVITWRDLMGGAYCDIPFDSHIGLVRHAPLTERVQDEMLAQIAREL